MSVFWLQSAAWWGLAALAIPVLIHLLTRHQSRRLFFPSLRFLRTTRLAALRRRTISDWPLLIVRLLIIGLATAALASPVFVSAARERSWSTRVARAVVRAPAADPSDAQTAAEITRLVAEERASAFVSAAFSPANTIADGMRDAMIWLEKQPPATREVVIVGDLRAASLTGRDLDIVPWSTGVRFMPVTRAARDRNLQLEGIAAATEGVVFQDLQITLEDESTDAHYTVGEAATQLPIEVRAAPVDQQRVNAALRAVLAEGVLLQHPERRVMVEFEGPPGESFRPPMAAWIRRAAEQLPEYGAGEHDGVLVVRPDIDGTDARVADVIARIVEVVFSEDLRSREPRVIPAATLAAWSRTPGPAPPAVPPQDEGDRRHLWAAVLVLLAIEHWLRRSRTVLEGRDVPAASEATAGEEARVA